MNKTDHRKAALFPIAPDQALSPKTRIDAQGEDGALVSPPWLTFASAVIAVIIIGLNMKMNYDLAFGGGQEWRFGRHSPRHPGESRDPLNRLNRAALPALHQFNGSRLSPG